MNFVNFWKLLWGPESGHFALALACAIAAVQCLVALAGSAARERRVAALAPALACAQALCLLQAFVCLAVSAARDDFSVRNIAENSARAKPMLYKITGIWGNHEGSTLLWVLILGLCGALVALTARRARLPLFLEARVLGVLGGISAGFGLFCLLTSNPFSRLLPSPADGLGMNPMLQDPGLAIHPPLLYAGYVGLAVPFAFAVAALLEGRADARWGAWMRPWAVGAWSFLTCGIAIGSWWSYYVLGWGGYWFWDPVENASLIPWLSGTALVHSTIAVEKRDGLKIWTLLLAIASFSFSLSGTFLVRSGILNSVHAFASDPARGVFILALLGGVTGGALALFAWRAPRLTDGAPFAPFSREGALVVNNILLCTLCAVVLTGTMYPPFMQLLTGRTLSVGKPFFDATTLPLFLILMLLLGTACALPWKRARLRPVLKRLSLPALLAAIAFGPAWFWLNAPLPALCASMAVWVIAASLADLVRRLRAAGRRVPRAVLASALAHIGVGVSVLGMCGMSAAHHTVVELAVGQTVPFAGRDWTLLSATPVTGPNYTAERASLRVTPLNTSSDGAKNANAKNTGAKNTGTALTLHPERRFFSKQHQTIAQVALHITPFGDLYAVLGPSRIIAQNGPSNKTRNDKKVWVLRLHDNPLAIWIWAGGGFMALGGLVSLTRRKRRPAPSSTNVLSNPNSLNTHPVNTDTTNTDPTNTGEANTGEIGRNVDKNALSLEKTS